MVKVFYGSKMNAFLGGVFFHEGVAEFADDKKGIEFANRYYRKYEVEEIEKVKATSKATKKKVKKDE
ncbi:hypothetical protein SDC9_176462 [bioreactor metagenome]|uniref:Uncharacterized protein n=1 Tax=bioreactor metagenome TaxID=1076179 RepID=A0A645GYA1_9ZZZZ